MQTKEFVETGFLFQPPEMLRIALQALKSTHQLECRSLVEDVEKALQERGQDEDNPAIHYGLIASGNQVIKGAHIRDTLAKNITVLEKQRICFQGRKVM